MTKTCTLPRSVAGPSRAELTAVRISWSLRGGYVPEKVVVLHKNWDMANYKDNVLKLGWTPYTGSNQGIHNGIELSKILS